MARRGNRIGRAAVLAAVSLVALLLWAPGAPAKPGDLIVADRDFSGNSGNVCDLDGCGALFRIDPAAVSPVAIAEGPPFFNPWGVAFDRDGSLLVADDGGPGPGGVYRVDPETGARTTVAAGAPFVNPHWVEVAPDGAIYLSDYTGGTVYRIDPDTGVPEAFLTTQVIAPGGIAIDPTGTTMYVIDDSTNAILRVDLASAATTTIFAGPPLRVPQDLALTPGGDLLISDHEGSPDLAGGLFRLDPDTGAFSTIAQGEPFNSPSGIAPAPGGEIYLNNRSGGAAFLGAVFRIDPETGERPIIAEGPPFTGLLGVAIEPPRCGGKPATIVGTTGRDKLTGSPSADVIATLGGKDKVNAGRGKDRVCGGKGNDRLRGGPGKDRLIGGKGRRDRCVGGKGRDRAKGCERGRV